MSMGVSIRCLLLETSSLKSWIVTLQAVAEAGVGELAVAATSTSYLIKTEKPYPMPGLSASWAGTIRLCRPLTLNPQPPPFSPHAHYQPHCIHKAIIRAYRTAVGAQGFPGATFLWQYRGTTADSSTSKPPSQCLYQTLPTAVTRHRRFCGYISSITDGGLEAIRGHSCMLDPPHVLPAADAY